SVAAAAAWFARRNARLDRGDRRGAARVAGAVFVASFAAALLALHPALIGDVSSLVPILFVPAGLTGLAWILYLAFEPYFRRHYPDLLVSWTRLVGGRFGDPLVGRDLLGGLLLGCASFLLLLPPDAAPPSPRRARPPRLPRAGGRAAIFRRRGPAGRDRGSRGRGGEPPRRQPDG